MFARDLVFVTGKGGTGKTTVAGALGVAAAARGRRTLICDLVGGARFAVEPSERLSVLHIDPRAALTEWMRRQPGGAVAAAVLGRSAAFAHFVDAAPGAKELVTMGKVTDMARDGAHDLVIADGPSTGHALAMLTAPRTVAAVARLGPIGAQARGIDAFLRDPRRTGYVGVALPEEMPMHELLELDAGLHDALGRGLDLIVVDGVYPDRFRDDEITQLGALDAAGPVRAALEEDRVARDHADRLAWLRDRTVVPVVTLPFVFTELGPRELATLAARFAVTPHRAQRAAARAAATRH